MKSCKTRIKKKNNYKTYLNKYFLIAFYLEDVNYSLTFINIKIQFASNQIQSDLQGIDKRLEYESNLLYQKYFNDFVYARTIMIGTIFIFFIKTPPVSKYLCIWNLSIFKEMYAVICHQQESDNFNGYKCAYNGI